MILVINLHFIAWHKYLIHQKSRPLIFGRETFVCNYRGHTFPVVLDQIGTHCSRDFGPLLHTDLLQILHVQGLSLGNTDFQLPPKIFYWVQVWRLARPLQELEMLLTELLFSCPGCVFRPIFNALTEERRLLAKISRYMAPSILPSIWCSCTVPFTEKHLQRKMFPPPCFTVGIGFLGLYSSFFLLQTQWPSFIIHA